MPDMNPLIIRPDEVPLQRVIAAEWDMFLAWFGDEWKPGQHVALIGPT